MEPSTPSSDSEDSEYDHLTTATTEEDGDKENAATHQQEAVAVRDSAEEENSNNSNNTNSNTGTTLVYNLQGGNAAAMSHLLSNAHNMESTETEDLRKIIRQDAAKLAPQSTITRYVRNFAEYLEYVESVHGYTPANPRDPAAITIPRVLDFLYYQGNRRKMARNKGKQRKGGPYFNRTDYDEVCKMKSGDTPPIPDIEKLQSVQTYVNALQHYADAHTKILVQNDTEIKALTRSLGPRKAKAKRDAFVEKDNPDVEVFSMMKNLPLIEEYFWGYHNSSERQRAPNIGKIAANLRNRYCYLDSLQTLVRAESLWDSQLSNYYFFSHQTTYEPQPYYVMSRTIYVGKTNGEDKGKALTCKSLRHKDPRMCGQGALALYLFARFQTTHEVFDFSTNETWFNVRTCVATGDHNSVFDSTKAMAGSTYSAAMKCCFKSCGIFCNNTEHFGRKYGLGKLEGEEVAEPPIKQLGNWGKEVYNKHYSGNLPLEAMRAAAGFGKSQGKYYLPRSYPQPPESLRKKVFPEMEEAARLFSLLPFEEQLERDTSRRFIGMMEYLSVVFIQDCCWHMINGRGENALFSHPFFQDPEFLTFKESFHEETHRLSLPQNDPTNNRLEIIVPAVGAALTTIQQQTSSIERFAADNNVLLHSGHTKFEDLLLANSQAMQIQSQQLTHHLCQISAHVHSNYLLSQNVAAALKRAGRALATATPDLAKTNNGQPNLEAVPPLATTWLAESASPSDGIPMDLTEETQAPLPIQSPAPQRAPYQAHTDSLIPPPPPTHYSCIKSMFADWFGWHDSLFAPYDGIQKLRENRNWMKTHGASAAKRVQRLRTVTEFASDYASTQTPALEVNEELIQTVTELYKNDNNKKVVLSSVSAWCNKKRKDLSLPRAV